MTKILLDEQPIAYDNSELTIRNMVIMNKQQFSSNEQYETTKLFLQCVLKSKFSLIIQ